MSDAERSWRGSTWERVCSECFGGDRARMLEHARRYVASKGSRDPDLHLGKRFRDIVGARNRRRWWARAVALLAELPAEEGGPTQLDVSPVLRALRRGDSVTLVVGSATVATLVPGGGDDTPTIEARRQDRLQALEELGRMDLPVGSVRKMKAESTPAPERIPS